MIQDKYKLDLKDRKILYELDANARQSCSQIAKKVGLSTEVVNYRIKKLEEENIITQYQLIANLSALGILQFKICLSLEHITSEKLKNVIERLKKNKSVKWIISCEGNWDLVLSLEANSVNEIDKLKNEVLGLFQGNIGKKSISILVEASTYTREYLLDKRESTKERIIMKSYEKRELDKTDFEILKQLSENARMPIIEIAKNLKLSERVVNYRIKQMLKNKIIFGFKIALNYEKLGIKFYKLFIDIESSEEKSADLVMKYLDSNKNIIHQVKVLGNWDLEPEFEFKSEEEFRETLKNLKDKFPDLIKRVDVITISQEHKFVYF